MSDVHQVLVVEDAEEVAAVLMDICRSLGCEARLAKTLAEVREAIKEGGFCAVLLDLQIPADEATAPSVGAGETALAMLRAHDSRRNADGHRILPIIAVTGYSASPLFVAQLFKAGIDDFLPKDFDDGTGKTFRQRLEMVFDLIRAALANAGRTDHERCRELVGTATPGAVHLAMTAEVVGRRMVVLVNGRRCELQGRNFLMLLRLAIEHQKNPDAWLTLHELGADRVPSLPTRLRESVAAALRPGDELLETRYGGLCRLAPGTTVVLNARALGKHPDARVVKMMTLRGKALKTRV